WLCSSNEGFVTKFCAATLKATIANAMQVKRYFMVKKDFIENPQLLNPNEQGVNGTAILFFKTVILYFSLQGSLNGSSANPNNFLWYIFKNLFCKN
ncbi:MAG: hypothetical protein LH473_06825, partial [Chitinophagales bacterium]|nr:hypothetical protein [Chitinophagales bacterium]